MASVSRLSAATVSQCFASTTPPSRSANRQFRNEAQRATALISASSRLIGQELPHGVLTVADEPIEGVLLGFAILMLWSMLLVLGYRQQSLRVVVLPRETG